ncbi:hypothetical protein M0R19_01135 [Candidatus Pacearchaeota archaeon]|jgi:hypothetical protein|nr:hypothetical protein [Candidatus Pacearchaeota archaeon]
MEKKSRGNKEKTSHGRKLALNIIIGIFIAIMIITLFNLTVSYFYEPPKYEDFCKGIEGMGSYPVKYGISGGGCGNCTFSTELQKQTEDCYNERGIPVYDYNSQGCTVGIKECDFCGKNFEDAMKIYNRNTFFVYAAIGFALVVVGLFISLLLIQIISLPAGAFLVIEAAVKNFDDKLYIIITFSLLIIAAVLLALKKLR